MLIIYFLPHKNVEAILLKALVYNTFHISTLILKIFFTYLGPILGREMWKTWKTYYLLYIPTVLASTFSILKMWKMWQMFILCGFLTLASTFLIVAIL
tara:strand:- start:2103 stop:2396 length:294 start_codon:yes stop_codon:yes gene_type:complete